MGFFTSSLPSVVGAGDVCSTVGSGSVGFLGASPFGFVCHPIVFFLCFPSSSCFFCCCCSAIFTFFCFFSFLSGVFSAPFVTFFASFFFLSPLSCCPSCCSSHLFSFLCCFMHFVPSFLLFSCRLLLLLFCLPVFSSVTPVVCSGLSAPAVASSFPSFVYSPALSFFSLSAPLLSLVPTVFSLGYSTPASFLLSLVSLLSLCLLLLFLRHLLSL